MKTVYVTVKMSMDDSALIGDVVGDMDYNFGHAAIHDTEIVDAHEVDEGWPEPASDPWEPGMPM